MGDWRSGYLAISERSLGNDSERMEVALWGHIEGRIRETVWTDTLGRLHPNFASAGVESYQHQMKKHWWARSVEEPDDQVVRVEENMGSGKIGHKVGKRCLKSAEMAKMRVFVDSGGGENLVWKVWAEPAGRER